MSNLKISRILVPTHFHQPNAMNSSHHDFGIMIFDIIIYIGRYHLWLGEKPQCHSNLYFQLKNADYILIPALSSASTYIFKLIQKFKKSNLNKRTIHNTGIRYILCKLNDRTERTNVVVAGSHTRAHR